MLWDDPNSPSLLPYQKKVAHGKCHVRDRLGSIAVVLYGEMCWNFCGHFIQVG